MRHAIQDATIGMLEAHKRNVDRALEHFVAAGAEPDDDVRHALIRLPDSDRDAAWQLLRGAFPSGVIDLP